MQLPVRKLFLLWRLHLEPCIVNVNTRVIKYVKTVGIGQGGHRGAIG